MSIADLLVFLIPAVFSLALGYRRNARRNVTDRIPKYRGFAQQARELATRNREVADEAHTLALVNPDEQSRQRLSAVAWDCRERAEKCRLRAIRLDQEADSMWTWPYERPARTS